MLAVVMKTAKQIAVMKGHQIKAWLLAGALVLCAPITSRAINATTPAAGVGSQGDGAAQAAPATRYSPGVADIVKLADAKVDAEVIKTYIRNSPTAYNPSATEIIALKDHGVGPEILAAMLQHGAEVRAQSMRTAQAPPNMATPQPNPGAATPYAPAPGNDYSAQAVYPNSAYSYPDYSYGYSYPAYGSGYAWPSY